MKTFEYDGMPFTEPRSHPWLDMVGSPDCRYYDLTASPALIRSSLEDFVPWSRYSAIETFYALLERLNRVTSTLESNDCAFTGPEPNHHLDVAKQLQCSGRVMVLFRALALNSTERIAGLENRLHHGLALRDPEFEGGAIGTTIVPVRYRALPPGDRQLGCELMISFWAWGSTEDDCMSNLGRLLESLSQVLDATEPHRVPSTR